MYLLYLFGGREEKEWCDLGYVKHLQMIEVMVVLLMSFSRMVSIALVLSEFGPILGNGYGI